MTEAERKRRRDALALAALLLTLERAHKSALRKAVRAGALGILAAGGTSEHVATAIYATTRNAVVRLRGSARDRIRLAWSRISPVEPEGSTTNAVDAAHAERAADGMSTTWRDKLSEAVDGGTPYRSAAVRAVDDLDPSIVRTAVTETIQSANDEILYQNAYASSLGYVVVETWESILDRRTCPECEAMDGQSVTRPDTFPQPPPLHPLCRCFLSTYIADRLAA